MPHYYVIDGLQRLTTLFYALAPRSAGTSYESGRELVELCFDLADPKPKSGSPICPFGDGQRASQRYIPLHILFDVERLREFQWGLLQSGHKGWLEESDRLVMRFQNYEVPIIQLVTDKPDVVAETFVRINSAGDKIRERDVLRALLWASELRLEATFDQAKMALEPHGWGELDPDLMLSVLKAMLGIEQYLTRPYELAASFKARPEALLALPEVLCRTVEVLNAWGVCGPASLPYAYPLVALARSIHRQGRDRVDAALPRLHRWFFQTAYGAYFTGITGSRLERAFDHVSMLVEDGVMDTRPEDLRRVVEPVTSFAGGRSRSARSLLLAIRIAVEGDRLRSKVGDGAYTNRRLVGSMGLQAFHRLDVRMPAADPASYVLCPSHQLEGIRRGLRGQLSLPFVPDPVDLSEYLLSDGAIASLRRGDLSAFLTQRRADLNDLEQRFVEGLDLAWAPSTPF